MSATLDCTTKRCWKFLHMIFRERRLSQYRDTWVRPKGWRRPSRKRFSCRQSTLAPDQAVQFRSRMPVYKMGRMSSLSFFRPNVSGEAQFCRLGKIVATTAWLDLSCSSSPSLGSLRPRHVPPWMEPDFVSPSLGQKEYSDLLGNKSIRE